MSHVGDRVGFQYVVLRCVPRADREEFVNVGVIVYSQAADFLQAAVNVDVERLQAFSPTLDASAVHAALAAIEAVCRGDPSAGLAAGTSRRERFGWLAAPRSTVIQAGPTHGGLTDDPVRELAHLLQVLTG